MSIKRLLLVDDGRSEIASLQPIVQNLPEGWETQIVRGGTQALETMRETVYDAIAAETQLPDMSGVELLKMVSESHPGTVRFIFSANADREQTLLGAGFVHQYISKSCNHQKFGAILENSLSLRQVLAADRLQGKIASIGSLPSPPEIYNQLVRELQSETASIRKIAELIRQDISITAKLLQVVNSAYFGLSTTVSNPLQAVNVLGLDTVKSMVLAAGVFGQFDDSRSAEFSINGIFKRSIAVGAGARLFATALGLEARATDDSLLGGMLHDVGKLVMLMHFCTELDLAARLAREKSIPLFSAEKEILGVSDAEIGAYLLSLWGIPDTVLEAAALHYLPHKTASPMLNVLTCVHLAYAFDQDSDYGQNSALDMDYLKSLGLDEQVEDLRNLRMGAVA